MACAQTGSGKTAGFLFPMIALLYAKPAPSATPLPFGGGDVEGGTSFPRALILAPTRELASQIYDEAVRFTFRVAPLRAVVVYGGADLRRQVRELSRGCHILVATPGRLRDLLMRGNISLSRCEYLVREKMN